MAEHVPNGAEATLMSNLHALNCRGIVLSWASLGQPGTGHQNNHANECVRT